MTTGANKRQRKRQNSGGNSSMYSTTVVKAPVASGSLMRRTRVPQIRTTSECTLINNTEPLASMDMIASGAVQTKRLIFHPAAFPWLTSIANCYSRFKWRSLEFIYIPTCPTSTEGYHNLYLGYDFLDPEPISMQQAEEAYRSISHPVWSGAEGATTMQNGNHGAGAVVCKVDAGRINNYYRFTNITNFNALSPIDKNILCPGYCQSTTVNGAPFLNAGRVYCKYSIELVEPIATTLNP